MVYVNSEFVETPDSGAVWRFRPYNYFESLLETSELYFSRVDLFSDPFEGSIPEVIADIRDRTADEETAKAQRVLNYMARKYSFANCWHHDNRETAARWERYGYKDYIAIRSSIPALKKSLETTDIPTNIGKVRYVDFTLDDPTAITKQLPEADVHTAQWIMTKRKSFEYENEVRLLVQRFPAMSEEKFQEADYNVKYKGEKERIPLKFAGVKGQTGIVDFRELPEENGVKVEIDLDEMVEEIRIAPKADDDFVDKVTELVQKSELDSDRVVQSDLDSAAIY